MLCLCCLTFYASLTPRVYHFRLPPAHLTSFALFFLPFSALFFHHRIFSMATHGVPWRSSHHFPRLARCVCCEGVLPQTRVLHACASLDFSNSDGFGLTTFSGFFWPLSLRHSTSCFCVRPVFRLWVERRMHRQLPYVIIARGLGLIRILGDGGQNINEIVKYMNYIEHTDMPSSY